MFLQRLLNDDFDVLFGHRFTQLPVHDVTAVAVEHARQIEEHPGDVDVRDVYVPMGVGFYRLHETGSLLGGREPVVVQPPGGLEYAVHAGRADGHDVVIEHHERQPAVAFQRMAIVEVEDGLLLPMGNPASFQSSPFAFFARTFSSINSAMTSFFRTTLSWTCSIL